MGAREIGRYSRHLLLPSFGVEAQKRLMQGSALVVGAGGLGAPALLYLAAAGVGASLVPYLVPFRESPLR